MEYGHCARCGGKKVFAGLGAPLVMLRDLRGLLRPAVVADQLHLRVLPLPLLLAGQP